MAERLQNVIYVYDKNMNLIARFGEEHQGLNPNQTLEGMSDKAMRELMIIPTVHIESNGESTLSFQMLANSTKWEQIKDPSNIYYVNGRYYTALTENSYKYSGEDTARIVEVTLVETWYLLQNKYIQAYNCGIYSQCEGTIDTTLYYQGSLDSNQITFKGAKEGCSNLGNTISTDSAWTQIRCWETEDKDGNPISYRLTIAENTPENNWLGAPQFVNLKKLTNVAASPFLFMLENPVRPVMKVTVPLKNQNIVFNSNNMTYSSIPILDCLYDYYQQKYGNENLKINSSTYRIIPPKEIKSVELVYTTFTNTVAGNSSSTNTDNNKVSTSYGQTTHTEMVDFSYSNGYLNFAKPSHYIATMEQNSSGSTSSMHVGNYTYNQTTFQYMIVEFEFPNMGALKVGTNPKYILSYGAEVVDEHTFLILPKADTKYSLTINGKTYRDADVTDSRGVIMPRGSGGYAMWAALKDSGWTLGVCDVIAKDFDTSIDYGCFNVEMDMKDVLSIILNIQSLYGGILDWDSEYQVLNYRAENSEDYLAANDDFNKWKGMQFREGKNLLDQPVITYDNDIITKAYILGYGNLNIKKVNDNKSYIEDYSYSKDVYEGYLTQELIYDTNDEGGQKQLLYWGKKELAKRCRPRRHIELQATDIRTTRGHEHEVFDINDIVKVYYHDSHDNSEHIEEMRITLWEYNVFAMWDCTVELGDKTQNEIEIFKLIYNKTLKTPNTNGLGQVSTNSIYLSPSNTNSSGSIGGINSIGNQLSLISQTTTDNSEAIAGLIVDSSSNYSYATLFAQYMQQTNEMLKKTYAGLEFYADEKMAYAIMESKYHSETLGDELHQEIIDTKAAVETYADKVGAAARLYVDGRWEELDGDIRTITQNQAMFEASVEKTYAKASQVAQFQQEVNGKITTTQASVTSLATKLGAQNSIIANFENELAYTESRIENIATEQYAMSRMLSRMDDRIADVYTYVDETVAEAGFGASAGDSEAYIRAIARKGSDGVIEMYGNINITSGKTFYYYNVRVGWTYVSDNRGNEWKVLGEYGQDGIYI